MLVAEIRRKLGDLEGIDVSAKEDLLTADVFGTIKYLPRTPHLHCVLEGIAQQNRQRSPKFEEFVRSMEFNEDAFQFRFWPTYPTPSSLPGSITEPDVELIAPGARIFFEAKLRSDFEPSQIARQMLIGLRQHPARFFLVLVTAGVKPPCIRWDKRRLELPDYLAAVCTDLGLPESDQELLRSNRDRILWISWRSLAGFLETAQRRLHQAHPSVQRSSADLVADLRLLLTMRGLGPFIGVGRMARIVSMPWSVLAKLPSLARRKFEGICDRRLPSLARLSQSWEATKLFCCPSHTGASRRGLQIPAVVDRRHLYHTTAGFVTPVLVTLPKKQDPGVSITEVVDRHPFPWPIAWSVPTRGRRDANRFHGFLSGEHDPILLIPKMLNSFKLSALRAVDLEGLTRKIDFGLTKALIPAMEKRND